jgi:hypothetical protein
VMVLADTLQFLPRCFDGFWPWCFILPRQPGYRPR